jgi:prolyl-tRNA editing enzyme YbaK/EbsC (Cys-tRNA(Pro) deacylase)
VHRNAAAVADAARALGLEVAVREFPEGTRTAEAAARAIGTGADQIVKSLVFLADGEPVLALVAGTNRLDESKLARVLGAAAIERAGAEDVRAATGYPIGGVPPFGHRSPMRCTVDRDLLAHQVVWAAAGTPRHVFPVAPQRLVEVIGATVADVALEDAATGP